MKVVFYLGLSAGLAAAVSVKAHEIKHKGLTIVHPWTAQTIAAPPNDVAVYMKIRNLSKTADRLLGASTPQAKAVQLHTSNNLTSLAVVSIPIPPGSELRPRFLLLGFAGSLDPYDSFPMTLVFEKAGRMEIAVTVEDVEQQPAESPR